MHKICKSTGEVYFALCKSVDTPRSLACWMLFKYGEFRQLVELSIDANDYSSAHSFARDFLVTTYLAKAEFLRTGIDTKAVALLKFYESEAKCKDTNERFKRLRKDYFFKEGSLSQILCSAQEKISRVLGTFHVQNVLANCRWGPGATVDIRKEVSFASEKYSKVLTTTPRALGWIKPLVESNPLWLQSILQHEVCGPTSLLRNNFKIVPGGRTIVVPKTAKTGRTIDAGPTANSYLQQGVGRYIRHRLKLFGIDLDNQETNQVWASLSHSLGLATLDLSAASDTIARELVYFLLPWNWANYLNDLRCDSTLIEGKQFPLEKFSAMGNAYTFELETLIFWALVQSVQEVVLGRAGVCSVYGDDIICEQSCASLVTSVLEYCGFTINDVKSHSHGSYYESCGKHYFNGIDVTPIYQKERLSDSLESLCRAGNRLIRHSLRLGFRGVLDGTCYAAYQSVKRLVRERCKYPVWIPLGLDGDDGLCVTRLDAPMHRTSHGAACCRVTRGIARYKRANSLGYLVHTLSAQGPVGLLGRNQIASLRSITTTRWVVPSEYFAWEWCV